MRQIFAALAALLFSLSAAAGNTGVLIEDVPQLSNRPAVIAAIKSAFVHRKWTIVASDATSVTATLSRVTTSKVRIAIEGRSIVYEETSSRVVQEARGPNAPRTPMRRSVQQSDWLENLRRDIEINVAAIPIPEA